MGLFSQNVNLLIVCHDNQFWSDVLILYPNNYNYYQHLFKWGYI